jgi:phage terminase large subunit
MPQIKDKYQPLYYSDKRYFILTGGRGSGKTFVVQDYLVRLLEQVGQGILYTRYTMTAVEGTIIPLFTKHIELISDIRKYHITKKYIYNKETGSFMMFSGIKTTSGDQTGNLKTLPNITTWVIEEGEDYNKEDSFEDIDDSIRGTGLQNRVIWIQNPTTRHHFIYKKFFKDSHEIREINGFKYQHCTHEDVEHIHTTYLDNKDNLDPKKVLRWEETKITNPKKYANKSLTNILERGKIRLMV